MIDDGGSVAVVAAFLPVGLALAPFAMSGVPNTLAAPLTAAHTSATASAPPIAPSESFSLSLSVAPSLLGSQALEAITSPAALSSNSDNVHPVDSASLGCTHAAAPLSRAPTVVLARDEMCAAAAVAPARSSSSTFTAVRSRSAAAAAAASLSLSPALSHSSVDPQSQEEQTVVLSAADLAMLLPSSAVPLATVLDSAALPECVRDALCAVFPNARSSESVARQRFTLAVAVAVQAHYGRAHLLGKPKSVLQLPPSESLAMLHAIAGRGLSQSSLTAVALAYGFSASLATLFSSPSLEKIDIACRTLLHALFLFPRSAGRSLTALYAAGVPVDAAASVLPSPLGLQTAPAVLQRATSSAVAPFPAFRAPQRSDFSSSLSPLLQLQQLPAVVALQQLSPAVTAAAASATTALATSAAAYPDQF